MLLNCKNTNNYFFQESRLAYQQFERPKAPEKAESTPSKPKSKNEARESSESKTAEVEMKALKLQLNELLNNKRWQQLVEKNAQHIPLTKAEEKERAQIESAFDPMAIGKYWELFYQMKGERVSEGQAYGAEFEREDVKKIQAEKMLKKGYKEVDIKSPEAKQIVSALKEAIPITSKVGYAIADADRGTVFLLVRDDLGKLALYQGREK